MQISGINFHSPQFCAKRKDVRKADDVCRAVKNEFPLLSSTYVEEKYLTNRNKSIYHPYVKYDIKKLSKKISDTRNAIRSYCASPFYNPVVPRTKSDKVVGILDILKEKKVGNCSENAQLALAAMYANGYYDSQIVGLGYTAEAIDDETGKVLCKLSPRSGLDHMFVVADVNDDGLKDVVVDPWLGFAGYVTYAIDKFKDIYCDETEKIKEKCEKKLKRYQKIGLKKSNSWHIRGSFMISPYQMEAIFPDPKATGEAIKGAYPSLVLKGHTKNEKECD